MIRIDDVDSSARGNDQELVAIMRMPARIAPLTKMHHTTVVIRRVPGRNDGLPRPRDRSRPPRRLFCSAFHRQNGNVFQGHDAHRHASFPSLLRVDISAPHAGARTVPQRRSARKPHRVEETDRPFSRCPSLVPASRVGPHACPGPHLAKAWASRGREARRARAGGRRQAAGGTRCTLRQRGRQVGR